MPQSFQRSRSCLRTMGSQCGSPSSTVAVALASVTMGRSGTGAESKV